MSSRLCRPSFFGNSTWQPSEEELATLHAEALGLAEQASDEDELWWVRIALLDPLVRQGSRDEIERARDVCAAAVAYFERRHNWPALSRALDECAACELKLGLYAEAREIQKRRLAWPQLPAWARGDVQSNIVKSYLAAGEYDACIMATQDTLAHMRPGDSLEPLTEAVAFAIDAAYQCGRWDDVVGLRQPLEQIWEEMQQGPGLYSQPLWVACMSVLQVALAREDRVDSDAIAALLKRMWPLSRPDASSMHGVVDAYHADDPTRFVLDAQADLTMGDHWALRYLEERGLPIPDALFDALIMAARAERYLANWDEIPVIAEIAEALASGDSIQLATAIDAMEGRHMIVRAARMRIVLAQRIGDRAPLERARPTLKRLGDRQFLRRLEDVERALSEPPKQDER